MTAPIQRTPPLAERIHPACTVLLVIDMQNDFVHAEGATARWMRARFQQEGKELPAGPSITEQMVPRLRELVVAARRAGVPVIWVRMEHDARSRDRFTQSEGWLYCEPGSWGAEFFAGLRPEPAEQVIAKTRHSAFFGTGLDAMLRERGVEGVVVTGTATQGCVEGTIRDANAHDFWAVVVGDCCGQPDPVSHQAALERMNRVFGINATAAEVMACWEPAAGTPQGKPAPAGHLAPPPA
jgi:ureidoacrylate peracid hydrolase